MEPFPPDASPVPSRPEGDPLRVLIQTVGSAGDVLPFVAAGRALRARGHGVVVLVNAAFEDTVRAAGLEPVVIGTRADYEATERDPDLWHPNRGVKVVLHRGVMPGLRPSVAALEDRLSEGDTVLLAGTLGFAARMVRERHRVPLVTMHLAPCAFETLHRMPAFGIPFTGTRAPRFLKRFFWWFSARYVRSLAGSALDAARAERGLPPVRESIFGRWVHSPDRIVAAFPEGFGPPQPDWPEPVRFAGFCQYDRGEDLDPHLSAWLDAGEPPVVFSAGSAHLFGRSYYEAALAATASLGVRALLVTRGEEAVPRPLPPHALHVPVAPFERLYPRAAAVVHHGGVGTCGRALAAGVPQLVAPMGFDQFDNATRLRDLGVGATLPMRRFRAGAAEKALAGLLGDRTVRERCAALAGRAADFDGAERTADLVEGAFRDGV